MGRRTYGDDFDDLDDLDDHVEDGPEVDDELDTEVDDQRDDTVDDAFADEFADEFDDEFDDEFADEFDDAFDDRFVPDSDDDSDDIDIDPRRTVAGRERPADPALPLGPIAPYMPGGIARPDNLPPLGKLARAVDEAPPYDPDAEDGLLHAGPRALETLVDAAAGRASAKRGNVPEWQTLDELRITARELAAGQTSHRQTALQRLVSPARMTQTEVCLRLAIYLLEHDMVTSAVKVHLPIEDVTRFRHPMFNIHEFMKVNGARLVQGRRPPYGDYAVGKARHGIEVCDSAEGSLVAEVGPGSRLVVYAAAGPTRDTSGSVEHMKLRLALGTALTAAGVGPNDLVAVALPRSPRMRRLAEETLALPRVAATAISIITVGRFGQIDGIPLFDALRPVRLEDE